MATSHNDAFQLSQSTPFQNRVQAALLYSCIAIANEGWGIAFHRERANFGVSILGTTATLANYVVLFSASVATDPNVLGDATQGGTVALTGGNRDAQEALVTDAHIDAAIASQFNGFIRVPQG